MKLWIHIGLSEADDYGQHIDNSVRKYMQYFMQEIYKKQHGLTPEEEHVISFLGSDNDDAVLEELNKRRLTNEKRDLLEGPINF